MAKQSQLDKAIVNLEGEVAVLQAAIVRLKQQNTSAPKPKPAEGKS